MVNWWVVLLCERSPSFCALPEPHPAILLKEQNLIINERERKRKRQEWERKNTFNVFFFFSWGGWTGLFIMTCIPPLTSLIERFRKTPWPLAFRTIGSGMFPSVRKPGQQQEHEGAHGKATVYCETGWEDLSNTHTSETLLKQNNWYQRIIQNSHQTNI